jgi:hypothetical protein
MRISARGGMIRVGHCVRQGKFCFSAGFVFFSRRMTSTVEIEVLSEAAWQERTEAHRARAERHTVPARMRRDRGLPHPITDFLFEYYPFPFSLLENWHPGTGIALKTDSAALLERFPERWHTLANGRIMADPRKMSGKEMQRMAWTIELLEATRDRAPNFACHGLHEWAMVYRGKEVRHERTLKLRLPQEEIDALVESRPICCSHHDAFRFFAAEARPHNRLQPDLASRVLLEQPGCLHANMDLYKWAAKSMPWTGSELLLDCFELSVDLRELDMRASPYDLTEWGREPVRIETAEGRRIYERQQKRLAGMARPLRERLIGVLRRTLDEAA